MGIMILDPTVEAEHAEVEAAKRIGSLDNIVLGLLSNGKVNADHLLHMVREGLASRYRLRDVVVRAKPNASRVAPDEVVEELARTCDAVVTAIGD